MAQDLAHSRSQAIASDERWAEWVAKGVAHDERINKQSIATATAVAAAVVLWLTILLLR